jgi:hypothetical protein
LFYHTYAVTELWQIQARLATEEEHVVKTLTVLNNRLGNGVSVWPLDAQAVILRVDAMFATVVALRREMHVERIIYTIATVDIPLHTPLLFVC